MPFKKELERIGKTVSSWQVEIKFCFWTAVIMGSLWVFTLSDIYIQFARFGRILSCLILAGLIVFMFKQISKIFIKHRTVLGIAATVEQAFPQLDNHLINYLQFSVKKNKDPFVKAYVKRGVPEWSQVKLSEMKDRKAHRKSNAAFGAACLIIALPFFMYPKIWGTSMWRVVNPLSSLPPVSLTKVISIDPGDNSARQGDPLIMTCVVNGRKGHKIWLDIKPSDGEKTTYSLGSIQTKENENFPHRIAKVTTDMKYRFRAGDAPFPKWHTIKVRPKLAFNKIDIRIVPPRYTLADAGNYDGLSAEMRILQHSRIDATIECNLPIKSAAMKIPDINPVKLAPASETVLSGSGKITGGNVLKFEAVNTYGETAEAIVNFTLIPDKEPSIQIISPESRAAMLKPGVNPNIQFVVADDYGLANIRLEQITGDSSDKSREVKTWRGNEEIEFTEHWQGIPGEADQNGLVKYRIVASDNDPRGSHTVKSEPIIFQTSSLLSGKDRDLERKKKSYQFAKLKSLISKIIRIQTENLEETRNLHKGIEVANKKQWDACAEKQKEIRALTADILKDPRSPLGPMTPTIQKLYSDQMFHVIGKLESIPILTEEEKTPTASKCVNMEGRILRTLAYAESCVGKTDMSEDLSVLANVLKSLIKEQKNIVETTQEFISKSAAISSLLVDQQDGLVDRTANFINACLKEAEIIRISDEALAESVKKIALLCKSEDIQGDMLEAVDKLDINKPKDALPHEETSLEKLRRYFVMLDKTAEKAKEEELMGHLAATVELKDKLAKLKDLQQKVMEEAKSEMRQASEDDKKSDELMEDMAEIAEAMEDAMLQVPKDLHMLFAIAPVAEVCEDMNSVFQELAPEFDDPDMQDAYEADSEASDVEIFELLAKGDEAMEAMEEAEDAADDYETWLKDYNESDNMKFTQESAGKDEQPEEMAMAGLAMSFDSLISDLADTTEAEDAADADEGASDATLPLTDGQAGEAKSGPETTFSGKGAAGSQRPEHKEQAGRGGVGREGMSNGECAGGSGTIQEGDPNMDPRVTNEPVQSGPAANINGEAQTAAFGGGKLATGAADGKGMAGDKTATRMDADVAGSQEGMDELMAKADALYTQASLRGMRTSSLDEAAHHIRQAKDCAQAGFPIKAIKEHEDKALAALKRAKTELDAGGGEIEVKIKTQTLKIESIVDGGAAQAPEGYQDQVSEYYKAINSAM
ncbi:hypothetical protein ACFLS1_04885 [Verrucomicrobiota bacterium]